MNVERARHRRAPGDAADGGVGARSVAGEQRAARPLGAPCESVAKRRPRRPRSSIK